MTDTSMPDAGPIESQQWSAQRYEDALAHLERLQEKLDALRATLPSLVAPLLQPDAARPQVFASVKEAAAGSTNDLKTLRGEWTAERTQQVLLHSKESLLKDGDLSKANEVARYGWLKEDR